MRGNILIATKNFMLSTYYNSNIWVSFDGERYAYWFTVIFFPRLAIIYSKSPWVDWDLGEITRKHIL